MCLIEAAIRRSLKEAATDQDMSDEESVEDEDEWVTVGKVKLKASDKENLLNVKGLLNDRHIMCAQYLIKSKFSNVCGLRSILLQQKKVAPLEPNSLQIIHLPRHWIAASTMNLINEDIIVYDSLSTKISDNTAQILAQLVHNWCTPAILTLQLKFQMLQSNRVTMNVACSQ